MASDYPTSIQTLSGTRGSASSKLNSPSHVDHHIVEDDTVEALQAKVGANSSAVTTSHDYKLSNVATGDKAVSLTGEETVTNKTLGAGTATALGSDATGDTYYRDSNGDLARLPKGNTNDILVQGTTTPGWSANPATTDATTLVRGVVELATQAEMDAGTTSGDEGTLVPNTTVIRAKKYHDYALATGAADVLAIDVSPSITAYATGQEFTFEANATNATTTPTLNVDGLGAKTIKTAEGAALVAGQILSGGIYKCVYDGTDMLVLSPLVQTTQTYQVSTVISSGTSATSEVITVGFTPKRIHFVIDCYDSNENASSWGVYDVDADTFGTLQQEHASSSVTIITNKASNAPFTDGQFIVDFDTFTSTQFTIQVARDGTWASGGTIVITAVR